MTRHAATAYPPPRDDVEVTVERHSISQRVDTDVLKGTTEEHTVERAEIVAAYPGRLYQFRYEDFVRGEMVLWHVSGSSSRNVRQAEMTIENAIETARTHTAQAEDPCDNYATAYVRGDDLTATVHILGYWGARGSRCGRDLSNGTRVLRASVVDDQWCGSCTRGI